MPPAVQQGDVLLRRGAGLSLVQRQLALGSVAAGGRVRGLWTPPTATSFDQVFDRMKLELEIDGGLGSTLEPSCTWRSWRVRRPSGRAVRGRSSAQSLRRPCSGSSSSCVDSAAAACGEWVSFGGTLEPLPGRFVGLRARSPADARPRRDARLSASGEGKDLPGQRLRDHEPTRPRLLFGRRRRPTSVQTFRLGRHRG